MKRREIALQAIFDRLYNDRQPLALKFCKRLPAKPIQPSVSNTPGLFMVEGVDKMATPSTRNPRGYPARRELEITLEMITSLDFDIKALFSGIRNTVFGDNIVVADDSFINEVRAEGPMGYEVPDLQGMRLILMLSYVDDGS